jgi:DNA-binding NarL/FixJ family response regulator
MRRVPAGGKQVMKLLRVLLADDHALVRAGIRSLVEKIPFITVVGEVSDGRAALDRVRADPPDLVLMDITMTSVNGLEAAACIAREQPAVRVIILSMHAHEVYVRQALRAGASGYLLKDAAATELERAIATVARGDVYLSPSVSRTVIEGYLGRGAATAPGGPLTPRQQEILKLIAGGKSTKEIAFELKVSVKTVETHRAQLMERLNIRDVPGLVRYALKTGLIADK